MLVHGLDSPGHSIPHGSLRKHLRRCRLQPVQAAPSGGAAPPPKRAAARPLTPDLLDNVDSAGWPDNTQNSYAAPESSTAQQPANELYPHEPALRAGPFEPPSPSDQRYTYGGTWGSSSNNPQVYDEQYAAQPPVSDQGHSKAPDPDQQSGGERHPGPSSNQSGNTSTNKPPSVNRANRASGADWGEPDPLTDWGGFGPPHTGVVSDSGWDEAATGASSSSTYTDGPALDGSSPWYGGNAEASSTAGFDGSAGPSAATAAPPFDAYGPGWDGRAEFRGPGAGPAGAGPPPPLGAMQPSDIVQLTGLDGSRILPLAPTPGQVDYYQPRTAQERIVQLMGAVGASVVLSKAALLAGPALLYPVWSPWIRAGLRNADTLSQSFSCVGLWRAQVLDVQISGIGLRGMLAGSRSPSVSLLIGDPWVGGARAQLDLPYQPRSELIRVGDAVELLVLSRDNRFVSFKVVREVYLPQAGVWLCDYPFLNRDMFLSISLAVERQRRQQAAEAEAAAAGGAVYDVPAEEAGQAAAAGQGWAAGGLGQGQGAGSGTEAPGW